MPGRLCVLGGGEGGRVQRRYLIELGSEKAFLEGMMSNRNLKQRGSIQCGESGEKERYSRQRNSTSRGSEAQSSPVCTEEGQGGKELCRFCAGVLR